nr:hypothetical protein [Tanacetum cinerariifolium]
MMVMIVNNSFRLSMSRGSHAAFQCQPMDQNIDFSGSDQIQTPQYPKIHPPSQEIRDEVFQAKGDLMKSIQTFLEEFTYIPFGEKPKILLQAWYKFFAIQEECYIDVCEEQKQNMENTILELVEIFRQKELYCMHDNVDDLIESALNFKLLSINSQRQNKEKQEVKNVEEQPTERRTHEIIKSGVEELVPSPNECEVTSEYKRECDVLVCEDSSTFDVCDNHSDIFFDSKNDDDISSDDDAFEDIEYVEASLPNLEIFSEEEENVVHQEEEEFDLEEIQDVVLREKLLSINRLIANIESLNENPTPDCVLSSSVSFPIFEESDNSLSDNSSPAFETFCDHTEETRSGNTTTHADDTFPEYDSFCFEIEPDQKRLINVVKNDISDGSSNNPLLEEADLFLALDNSIPPGIENFAYDSKGDICFLKALLSDDSILFLVNESSGSDAEFDFKLDVGEEISVVMNDSDEFECLDPNDENDNFFPFMFVIRIFLQYLIYSKMFLSFLFSESEDTIFDPGFTSH